MEGHGLLDPTDEIHLFALHYVFLPRINKNLEIFRESYNKAPLSAEKTDLLSNCGGLVCLRWLDSLNHGTLYFFRHRIFHSARVKLSLGHCIALLVVFIIGKVLFSYRSYVQRHCCHG